MVKKKIIKGGQYYYNDILDKILEKNLSNEQKNFLISIIDIINKNSILNENQEFLELLKKLEINISEIINFITKKELIIKKIKEILYFKKCNINKNNNLPEKNVLKDLKFINTDDFFLDINGELIEDVILFEKFKYEEGYLLNGYLFNINSLYEIATTGKKENPLTRDKIDETEIEHITFFYNYKNYKNYYLISNKNNINNLKSIEEIREIETQESIKILDTENNFIDLNKSLYLEPINKENLNYKYAIYVNYKLYNIIYLFEYLYINNKKLTIENTDKEKIINYYYIIYKQDVINKHLDNISKFDKINLEEFQDNIGQLRKIFLHRVFSFEQKKKTYILYIILNIHFFYLLFKKSIYDYNNKSIVVGSSNHIKEYLFENQNVSKLKKIFDFIIFKNKLELNKFLKKNKLNINLKKALEIILEEDIDENIDEDKDEDKDKDDDEDEDIKEDDILSVIVCFYIYYFIQKINNKNYDTKFENKINKIKEKCEKYQDKIKEDFEIQDFEFKKDKDNILLNYYKIFYFIFKFFHLCYNILLKKENNLDKNIKEIKDYYNRVNKNIEKLLKKIEKEMEEFEKKIEEILNKIDEYKKNKHILENVKDCVKKLGSMFCMSNRVESIIEPVVLNTQISSPLKSVKTPSIKLSSK